MKNESTTLCDPITKVCNAPSLNSVTADVGTLTTKKESKVLKVLYFTDPICSACWAIEPQLKQMKSAYGHLLSVEYCMGGLLPSWKGFNGGGIASPDDVYHHWNEMSELCDMPISGDVWRKDPLESSYPPSIAFKAAQLQDAQKASLFMRRLRELVFVEGLNICRPQYIDQAATYAGLDVIQLQKDIQHTAPALFNADLQIARAYGVRGFPTLIVQHTANGTSETIFGIQSFEKMEKTIKRLQPDALPDAYDRTPNALFACYGSLTVAELAALTATPLATAQKTLDDMVSRQQLKVSKYPSGNLYKK